MAKKIHLQVLTPSKAVINREVDFVILRAAEGDMGVLPGHEPCAALLGSGLLKAFENGEQTELLVVMGGVAMVRDNQVTVLSGLAEHPAQVEAELERRKRELQEKERQEQRSELEINRAEMALRRALLGMDFGAHTVVETLSRDEHEQANGEQHEES